MTRELDRDDISNAGDAHQKKQLYQKNHIRQSPPIALCDSVPVSIRRHAEGSNIDSQSDLGAAGALRSIRPSALPLGSASASA